MWPSFQSSANPLHPYVKRNALITRYVVLTWYKADWYVAVLLFAISAQEVQ